MEFENDVFVSYAHIDDQALAEGQPGWISSLHRALQVRLEQLLGKEAKIWRDLKLQGNDIFSDRLLETLPKVGVLVSVLSPRYVKSEWCQRELNAFLQASLLTGGTRVKDKLRVFKVVKTPIPREEQPAELQSTLGYEFFTVERDSGRQRELGPMSPPDAQSLYWVKLDDLAHDIADLLNILEGQTTGAPTAPAASKGTVYLAETSSDLRDRRDAVRRELLGQGYSVLPDKPLPLVEPDFSASVREHLAQSKLSVHMVGENYGVVPDDTTQSIVVLQHELAIERASASDFCRLIWMPPNLIIDDERQRTFIERLENDSRCQSGADILKTPLEDFKTVLHVRLNPPPPKVDRQAPPPGQSAVQRVYLICDQRDVDATRPLVDYLFERFEVTLPVFDGDESQVRREHEANLAECDAVVIYYGAGNELWLRSKLRELQKIAGYGRTKPMLAKAVYVAPPDAPEKERFRTHDAIVIKAAAQFAAAVLEPFVGELTQARQVS
jgi:hypothetical protein